MKKRSKWYEFARGKCANKFMKIMRLTCLLMFIFILHLSAESVAQQVVSAKFSEQPLREVFREIKAQTGLYFMYNSQEVDVRQRVSVELEQVPWEEALEKIFEHLPYRFEVTEGYVLVVARPKTAMDDKTPKKTVHGVVIDKDGLKLPGVSIVIKGTGMGTVTDVEGNFKLDVPSGRDIILQFSFVGMESKEVKADTSFMKVVLKESVEQMDEVVVTGYANVSKGNYTGASTTIQAADILMPGVTSIDQMLQGVVPGMLVWNTTGQVGATSKIRVRGTSTLLGSQEPVWVVDGVVQRDPQPFDPDGNMKFSVDADDIRQLAGNAISWLNPNDIETITILKDASATAIYGSKAANGVIVITTKKATIGKLSVNYSGDFAIGQRPRYGLYDLMNSKEFMQFSKDVYDERREYPTGSYTLPIGYRGLLEKMLNKEITLEEMDLEYKRQARQNTDWFKLLFRNSFNHSHSVGMSGGSEKIQNRTSFGFRQDRGEAIGNNMTSFTVNSNTTVNFGEKLTINMSLNATTREVEGFAYGVDPFSYAYNTSRAVPAYNSDGSLFYHEKIGTASMVTGKNIYNYNILNELANTGSKNTTRTWGTTIDLQWYILSGLVYQGLVAYASSSADTKQYVTERSFYITQTRGYEFGSVQADGIETKSTPLPMGGLLETGLTNTTNITVRNSLVYNKQFKDKHRMTLQLGIETNSVKTKGETSKNYGYLPDRGETFATPPTTYLEQGMADWINDNTDIVRGGHSVINRIENELSEYASIVYSYDDRYVFNFNARVDASNRFGQDKNKRFEPTWSVGGKWRIANEYVIKNLWWLNNLDLYGSYGYQGNAVTSVSPYLIARDEYSNLYHAFSLRVKSLPYPNLGWEKTKNYNIGVEASLFKSRVNFTFNYFKKVSNVLASREIPYENGQRNGIVAGSTMKNHGYDFVINVIPVQTKNFIWQLSLNTSVARNSIEKNQRTNTLDDYLNGTCVVDGSPYSTFYSYEFECLDPENGQPLFKNMDIENATSPIEFLVESGKFTPDFSGGLNTMFKYKRLSLYALFAVQWGGHKRLPSLYPETSSLVGLPDPEQNVSRKLIHRWKKEGDDIHTSYPALAIWGEQFIYTPMTAISTSMPVNRHVMYNNSNVRVANTNFIRCRSISLSYEFKEEWLKRLFIQRLQINANMTNPFAWVSDKKWDGLDPETGDWPARRTTSLSLHITF